MGHRWEELLDLISLDHAVDSRSGDTVVLPFTNGEMDVGVGIVHRLEFSGARCNLTLRNRSSKAREVGVLVAVLDTRLVELWRQSENWLLSLLQPDQQYTVSWGFQPQVPAIVWNKKWRESARCAVVVIHQK